MLVSALITELLRENSETQQDTGFNNTVLSWVRDAIIDVGNRTEWRYLQSTKSITTVAGTREYDLDVNTDDIISIEDETNGRKIPYLALWRITEQGGKLADTGDVKYWYYSSTGNEPGGTPDDKITKIGLWKVPNSVVTLKLYIRLGLAQITTSSIIPFPDRCIPAIKHKVRSNFALFDKDADAASIHLQLFEREIELLVSRERTKNDSVRTLQATDIPRSRARFAGLDPDHFRN